MSFPQLFTHCINLFCGTYLTWQTTKKFHQAKGDETDFDSLLIRWIFLTLLIYLEVLFIFFVDWIPLLGTILALMPLAGKVYIILPHSQGYLKIYGLLEQMELDDQTNKLMYYLQGITCYLVLRALKVIENFVDLIRADDLDLVETALQQINQQIIDKKSVVEVMKSFSKPKAKDPLNNPPLPPRNTEVFRSNYEGQKIKRNLEDDRIDDKSLTLIAGVLVQKESNGQEAVFQDYRLVFNVDTTELSFFDLASNTLQYRKPLREIHHQNKKHKCLQLVFEDFEELDDSYTIIKLRDLSDTQDWLKPVLEILVIRLEQFEHET